KLGANDDARAQGAGAIGRTKGKVAEPRHAARTGHGDDRLVAAVGDVRTGALVSSQLANDAVRLDKRAGTTGRLGRSAVGERTVQHQTGGRKLTIRLV